MFLLLLLSYASQAKHDNKKDHLSTYLQGKSTLTIIAFQSKDRTPELVKKLNYLPFLLVYEQKTPPECAKLLR